jgi:hypothetical protein
MMTTRGATVVTTGGAGTSADAASISERCAAASWSACATAPVAAMVAATEVPVAMILLGRALRRLRAT